MANSKIINDEIGQVTEEDVVTEEEGVVTIDEGVVTEARNIKYFEGSIKGRKAIVMFSSLECGPCKTISEPLPDQPNQPSSYEILSKKYPKVRFVIVYIQTTKLTFAKYFDPISEMYPTFKFFVKGKIVEKFVGANIAEVEAMVQRNA